jgi:hypothetical protein
MYRAARWFERLRSGFDTHRLALRLDAPSKKSAEQTAAAALSLQVWLRTGSAIPDGAHPDGQRPTGCGQCVDIAAVSLPSLSITSQMFQTDWI